MKPTTILTAVATLGALAGLAAADHLYPADIAGALSWDLAGDADNLTLSIPVDPNRKIIGLGFDASLTTFGASWASEATIRVGGDAYQAGVDLTPGAGVNTGVANASFSSAGLISFGLLAQKPLLLDDDQFTLEFLESFDDLADDVDAEWMSGTVTIETAPRNVWNEQIDGLGDAGPTPDVRQRIEQRGGGEMVQVLGAVDMGDFDLYQLFIKFPAFFSLTVSHDDGGDSPSVFLLDPDGVGLAFAAGSRGGPTVISNATLQGRGVYHLAVAERGAFPVDADGQPLWNPVLSEERGPDGPGALNPIAGWTASNVGGGDYTADFTGSGYLPIPGDLDGDDLVGPTDLAILLASWGPCPSPPPTLCTGDITFDGMVGPDDLAILLAFWSF